MIPYLFIGLLLLFLIRWKTVDRLPWGSVVVTILLWPILIIGVISRLRGRSMIEFIAPQTGTYQIQAEKDFPCSLQKTNKEIHIIYSSVGVPIYMERGDKLIIKPTKGFIDIRRVCSYD